MTKARLFHHFGYGTVRSATQPPTWHKVRDGSAFAELSQLIARQGYDLGDLLFQAPLREKGRTSPRKPIDSSEVWPVPRPSDLIVMTTRPPLDDDDSGDRKVVQRSYTSLEFDVLAALRPCFELCTRTTVSLSPRLVSSGVDRKLIPWTLIHFQEYGDWAWCRQLKLDAHLTTYDFTAAFLVYRPSIGAGGTPVLAVWGMGGNDTLLWCRLLRTLPGYQQLVAETLKRQRSRFVLAKLIAPAGFHQPARKPSRARVKPPSGDPDAGPKPLRPSQPFGALASLWSVETVLDLTIPD